MNTKSIVIAEIQSDLQSVENDATLFEEINFESRTNAIDFIDFHIIDRVEGLLLQGTEPIKELEILKRHAQKVKSRLEEINTNLFNKLKENIRTGFYAKSSFMKMIREYLPSYIGNTKHTDEVGFDNLDIFINGQLYNQHIPETTKGTAPEMVFYQKTPARIIVEMANVIKQDDVFFDIGSGPGQAVMLVNLLSGAKAIGIEYEPAYCNYAKECALQLNLSNVEFINGDALNADYSQGTIFFMYTPFEGSMLQRMLHVLHKESQKRTIRIFTYGPCSPDVAKQNWLNCVNGNADNFYKLYEFRSLDA